MNAEQRAVFQGIVYYYRENQVLCRYQATLKEAVDPALLQQALDASRPLAEYYFCHVVWEKREARLEPNTAPCRVRQGKCLINLTVQNAIARATCSTPRTIITSQSVNNTYQPFCIFRTMII